MTGFGEGRSESDTIAVSAEIRSINNRHLKINFRASDGYQSLEARVEALLRDQITRGSVQLSLRIERLARKVEFLLNAEVLASYQKQIADIAGIAADSSMANSPPVDIASLLTLPGVITTPTGSDADPETDWPTIKEAISNALTTLGEMRRHEGEALADDLRNNCQLIAKELKSIEERSPDVAEEYRTRLHERIGQALEKFNVSLEPADLVREVALYVDRSDISEEAVRLRCHIEQFEATLKEGENSGRKLEFIAQEMGRETNTIGSKASDNQISQRVVEIKAALERIREQVQNVE